MTAIDAQNVELTYADGTEAVRDVTLRVPEGEFFGFLGANGAGKTTMIKTLVTLLEPSAGEITVNGFDVETESHAVRGSIGYMAQETSIDEELTARENVQFACEAYGVSVSDREERITELLELVDLTDVAGKLAKGFSGGMKKRLDVAMALVHQPPIVFLDEPTTGLDPEARNRLWEYFRSINEQGTTVFLTTQYLEEADQLCDRISVIQEGSIVVEGSPAELKSAVGGDVVEISLADSSDPSTERARDVVRASEPIDAEASIETTADGISVTAPRAHRIGPELIAILQNQGFTVTSFKTRSPTLDDVFLAITNNQELGNEHDQTPTTDATDEPTGQNQSSEPHDMEASR